MLYRCIFVLNIYSPKWKWMIEDRDKNFIYTIFYAPTRSTLQSNPITETWAEKAPTQEEEEEEKKQ